MLSFAQLMINVLTYGFLKHKNSGSQFTYINYSIFNMYLLTLIVLYNHMFINCFNYIFLLYYKFDDI